LGDNLAADKKPIPRKPESLIISEDDKDNLFFSLDVDGENGITELSLIVNVNGKEDEMAYLHSVFLETEDLKDVITWLNHALRYSEYIDKNGPVISLFLDEDEDD
jgi:hypothetical protein